MQKFISGWICLIGGIILEIFTVITINNDKHPQSLFGNYYSYESPLSGHEIFMISLAVLGVIIIIAGLVKLGKRNGNQNTVDMETSDSIEKSDNER